MTSSMQNFRDFLLNLRDIALANLEPKLRPMASVHKAKEA